MANPLCKQAELDSEADKGLVKILFKYWQLAEVKDRIINIFFNSQLYEYDLKNQPGVTRCKLSTWDLF